ncbi:hypothetical protein IMZ48_06740 [Candidatus Bathyarchaeota archaeon]|nr:hypothetical protein [Candidatus Bathyarchaeota archaeon]
MPDLTLSRQEPEEEVRHAGRSTMRHWHKAFLIEVEFYFDFVISKGRDRQAGGAKGIACF